MEVKHLTQFFLMSSTLPTKDTAYAVTCNNGTKKRDPKVISLIKKTEFNRCFNKRSKSKVSASAPPSLPVVSRRGEGHGICCGAWRGRHVGDRSSTVAIECDVEEANIVLDEGKLVLEH